MRPIAIACVLAGSLALAAPPFPMPKLPDVMRGSLTDKARIRWSKVVEGNRVQITISGGVAERLNPNMAPEPAKLKYDLARNRALEQIVKAAHLGSPNARTPSSLSTDRTLEILAEGPKDWVVVGTWVMPAKSWKKKKPALFGELDPMFDVQAEVFGNMKSNEQ
jgi:hypothetical protein